MSYKRTVATATSSYLQVGCVAFTSLLMLRIASQNLQPEEFGLWGFITLSVGYLLLLDLGVSSSLGRMFGEPLAHGDIEKFNAWLNLAIILLLVQGFVIVVVGFLIESWILGWFNIPAHLFNEASILWRTFLIVSGMGLVFRVANGVLFAQNRVYLSNLSPIVTSFVSLVTFYIMIERGGGVLSYAWSTVMGAMAGWSLGVAFVLMGPTTVKINLRDIEHWMFRRLFGFASATFLISIAIQVFFAGQGLIVTKLLGLEMAAIFAVTTRIPLLLMQIMWKPFDAFTPRWQVQYCEGNVANVKREFRLLTEATILLGAVAGCFIVLALPSFICLWTKPEYFGGPLLVILLAYFLLEQSVLHCASHPFFLSMRVKTYSKVVLANTIVSLIAMIIFTRWIGLPGTVLGALCVSMLFSFWYHIKVGFGVILYDFLKETKRTLLISVGCVSLSCALLLWFPESFINADGSTLLLSLVIASLLSLPLLNRVYSISQKIREV